MAIPVILLSMGSFASIVIKKLVSALLKTLLTEKMVMEMFLYIAEHYAASTKSALDDGFVQKIRERVDEVYGEGGK